MHLKWLLPLLPVCTHYVEPFSGSGVVLLNRAMSPRETYNDLDGEIVNFLKMVREKTDELQRLIELTPYSRAEFAASLGPCEHLSDLERARRFYVRVRQSHMSFSVNAVPSNWGTTPNHSGNGMSLGPARFRSGVFRFNEIASRLTGVSIESRPAAKIIAAYDGPDRLFYCDPPYLPETWTRKEKGYTNVLTDEDHRELAQILNECHGKVAISGYESSLYSDLFPSTQWRKLLAPPKRSRASKVLRQEILWCNYDEDGERIQRTMISGVELEIPTSASAEVDALVSHTELAANDLWDRLTRKHKALHAFMGRAYALAGRLKDDESEFCRVMQKRGIKRPKIQLLYYQIIQAFQPDEQRADPDMKSEASRLKRAFIQAEARGYAATEFVRQIEKKELVGKRKINGVNKLIEQAKLANPSQKAKRPRGHVATVAESGVNTKASHYDLSRYIAIILNKTLSRDERLIAMDAAADEVEGAGIAASNIRFQVSIVSDQEATAVASANCEEPEHSEADRKARQSGKARNSFDILSRSARLLPFNHPALTERRTVYPGMVMLPSTKRVLIEGVNNAKTGPRILKSPWAGLRIYTLTLEERATCATTCEHWRSCFGNNMQWAQRFQTGPVLEEAIRRDAAELTAKHPAGIAVRLHVLGDFYSPAYVRLWADLMRKHATLRLFGFTRRWDAGDPIADALRELALEQPERFRIRLSNAPADLGPSTVSVEYKAPAGAIVCPAQLHQTETCSTCALCWSTEKQIAFIQH